MRHARRLIQQPAIDDEIERIVRGADLQRAKCALPEGLGGRQRRLRGRERCIARRQFGGVRAIATLSQREADPARFTRLDLEHDVQRAARVEAGARSRSEPRAEERRRRRERAIAPDEFGAIAGK